MDKDAEEARVALRATHLFTLGQVRFNLSLAFEGKEQPSWPLDNSLTLLDNRVDVARFYVSWALWFSQGVGIERKLNNNQLYTVHEFQDEAWLHLSQALVQMDSPDDAVLLSDATEKLQYCAKLVEMLAQQH